ncbi:MAG: AMP-binding protein [Deltaproteobacteria bacterium]|nr:AMP-binding protein [Deltaproteobacteria bacterium]
MAAEKYKKTGIIVNGFRLTYPEVKDHADRLAAALYDLGLKKGERVATLLPTCIQYAVADYAIGKAGLVHVPSSFIEAPANLEHKFSESSPKALVCIADQAELGERLLKTTSVKYLILTDMDDYSDNPPAGPGTHSRSGILSFMDLIRSYPPRPPRISFHVETDLETLIFTGGTTGVPKGCMVTHRNTYANTLQTSLAFGGAAAATRGAVAALLGIPFFHSYGHVVMHSMTYNGYDQVLIPDARDVDAIVESIRRHHPVVQFGVPTQFLKMSAQKLSNMGILGLSGSAPLPPGTQKEFEEKSGGGIMEGYGLSEMGPATHMNPSFLIRLMGGTRQVKALTHVLSLPGVPRAANRALRLVGPELLGMVVSRATSMAVKATRNKESSKKLEKRGTVGIPMPDTEIRFLDLETGRPLSYQEMLSGARGELLMRGPQRMLGYWPEPGTGIDPEGWVHTSDVVQIDERGYFYIVDRTKDMINVSGMKVYSREIDDLLNDHPKVLSGAAVGVPDPEREGSERVAVFAVPKPGCGDLTEQEIIDYLKQHVAKYAMPKLVRIVDEMPVTAVQKLDKKALRKMAEQELAKQPAKGGKTGKKEESS